jgi:hypothetical protein
MRLKAYNEIAQVLIDKYANKALKISWMNSFRVMGYMVNDEELVLSIEHAVLRKNNLDVFKNTVLHEIAHANVGIKNGHNYLWRKEAARLNVNDTGLDDDMIFFPFVIPESHPSFYKKPYYTYHNRVKDSVENELHKQAINNVIQFLEKEEQFTVDFYEDNGCSLSSYELGLYIKNFLPLSKNKIDLMRKFEKIGILKNKSKFIRKRIDEYFIN